MAFEKIGLGGFLTFNVNPAVSNMYRARAAMSSFVQGANQIPGSMNRASSSLNRASLAFANFKRNAAFSRGFGQITAAMGGLGLAMAPLSLGLGLSIKDAMNFEAALARVDSVVLGTKKELKELGTLAKTLTGNFAPTEIVEGIEAMSRAGARFHDIVAGLPGIIAAASVEGLDLGKTAEIVGKAASVMGLGWEAAARVGNSMARASADTQASMTSIGEAFKYGGSAAKSAGLDFETATAMFSRLSDAGIDGSTAGTGMQEVLKKLAKPSKEGLALLKDWNIQMTHNEKGQLDLIDIFRQVAPHMEKYNTDLERNAANNELWGVRGSRFAQAAMTLQTLAAKEGAKAAERMGEDFDKLTEREQKALLRGEMSFENFAQRLRDSSNGVGMATEMAKRRLDSLSGSVTVFLNQIKLANVEMFQPMLKPLSTSMRHFSEFFGTVLTGLTEFRVAEEDVTKQWQAMDKTFTAGGSNALNVMMGINDAIRDMGEGFEWAEDKFNRLTGRITKTFGGNGVRSMTRFALMFGVIGGLMSPILIGLAGIALVLKMAVIPLFSGVLTIVTALVSTISLPMIALAGAATLAFATIRREGESFGDTLSRVFWTVIGAGQTLYDEVLQPIFEGFKEGFNLDRLGPQLTQTTDAIKGMFSSIFGQIDIMNVQWKDVGKSIGNAFITGLSIAMSLIQIVSEDIAWIVDKFKEIENSKIGKYFAEQSNQNKQFEDKAGQFVRDIASAFVVSDDPDAAWLKQQERDKEGAEKIRKFFFDLFPKDFKENLDRTNQNQKDLVNGRDTLQSGGDGPMSALTSLFLGKASANDNGAVGDRPIGPGYSKKGQEQDRSTLYDAHIAEAAQAYKLPEALIRAVIKQESNFNPNAVSRVGAQGLMQMMPKTAESMGVQDSFDPRQNIMGGAKYLRKLSDRWDGDMTKTIASYNAGPGNVQKYGGIPPFAETQRYTKRVLGRYEDYSGAPQSSPAAEPYSSMSYDPSNSSMPIEALNQNIQRASENLMSRSEDNMSEGPGKRFFSQLSKEEQKKMGLMERAEAIGNEWRSKFFPDSKSSDAEENMDLSKSSSDISQALKEKDRQQNQPVQNNITVKAGDMTAILKLDGKEIARTVQREREEVAERAGFRNTPWERRINSDHGASRLSR